MIGGTRLLEIASSEHQEVLHALQDEQGGPRAENHAIGIGDDHGVVDFSLTRFEQRTVRADPVHHYRITAPPINHE